MTASASNSSCVILIPIGGAVDADCDDGLRELERRGYPVWRVRGYSAIDAARNQMATDALSQGFAELMWIDSDIAFDPNDVDRLRAHNLPIACGLYPKKGPRQFACEFLPGASQVKFGRPGGLEEIRYCGFGFTHIRREVFQTVQKQLKLPTCNKRFDSPLVPFFAPMEVDEPGGPWSISEDYAFCERARKCGFKVWADTRIRLWHVGPYRFGWEDAGSSKERYADYTFHLPGAPSNVPTQSPPPVKVSPGDYSTDWFTYNLPVWERILKPLKGNPVQALEIGVFEGRSTVWLLENIMTNPEASLSWIDTFSGSAEHTDIDFAKVEKKFHENTRRFGTKVKGWVGKSQDVLRSMSSEQFDLVYIDGSHEAPDVLSDAVLAWTLLKPGGLMGFDDYEWHVYPAPERCPALAIDAFVDVMRGQLTVLDRGYQVWVKKNDASA
ncbi:MAG TPA: class I SAM-dependent methyltransferase [Gemmata sp.]|nr:class I SAM-dependent methyltransferase [Gemmata sp.]